VRSFALAYPKKNLQTPLSVRQRAKAVIRSTSLRMKPDSPAATACAAPIRAPSDNRPR
jgi:hypothetical protein